jgi:putative addiction module component (TIGR02574 family)
MKAISELAREALELPPGQRRALARILLELSEEDQDFSTEVHTAWEDEISRRLEAVRKGTAQSSGLEEVFSRLDLRFPS